jgi:hypothetical protein
VDLWRRGVEGLYPRLAVGEVAKMVHG